MGLATSGACTSLVQGYSPILAPDLSCHANSFTYLFFPQHSCSPWTKPPVLAAWWSWSPRFRTGTQMHGWLGPRPRLRTTYRGETPSTCCFRGFGPGAFYPVPHPLGLDTPVLPPSGCNSVSWGHYLITLFQQWPLTVGFVIPLVALPWLNYQGD
jgi:hypothetical protein